MQKKETFGELIRFGIVGTTAAAIHYAIYWVLQHWINVNVAYTIGYVLSFLVNYLLHIVLFNFFLWVGLSRELAPIAVLAIAVPTNFVLVRFVFKHFKRS